MSKLSRRGLLALFGGAVLAPQALVAAPAVDKPIAALNISYQWLLNGKPVPGQTGPIFTYDGDCNGKLLSCRAIYS